MKKTVALILCLVMALSLCACGSSYNSGKDSGAPVQQVELSYTIQERDSV